MNNSELDALLGAIGRNNGVSTEEVRREIEKALAGTQYAGVPIADTIEALAKAAKGN